MPPLVEPVPLRRGVRAWFTGRALDDARPQVGQAGNLSARRPHEPARLAADRQAAYGAMGLDAREVHTMRQVHGTDVTVVTDDVPAGAQAPDVDALVSSQPGRALAVMVADCVPLLVAAPGAVAAAHAGRLGALAGIVDRTLDVLDDVATGAERTAAIGPSIRGCCYEVPAAMQADAARRAPAAATTTTWGTPSIDLPTLVAADLARRGVDVVDGGVCTACDERWFSHRRDPESGRQVGVIVLEDGGDREGDEVAA